MKRDEIFSVGAQRFVDVVSLFCDLPVALFLVIVGWSSTLERFVKERQPLTTIVAHSDTASRHDCHECIEAVVRDLASRVFPGRVADHVSDVIVGTRKQPIGESRRHNHTSQ